MTQHHKHHELIERISSMCQALNSDLEFAASHGLDLEVTILKSSDDSSYNHFEFDQVRIRQIIELA